MRQKIIILIKEIFINHMFPLIAIAAFFILAIVFFVLGKDDFGITRLKEDPNNTLKKAIEISTSELSSEK